MNQKKLGLPAMIAFAGPGLASTLLVAPIFSFIASYYALNTAVTFAQVGTVFLVARIFDAVTDPAIGVLSDRTKTRFGARVPWMAGGILLAIPTAYFLFLPPSSAGMLYFFITSNLVMLGWTMMTIPHNAWAVELTSDYDTRSQLFGVKNMIGSVGGMSFFLLPLLMFPLTGTTEITSDTMVGLLILLAVFAPLSLFLAVKFTPHVKHPVKGAHGFREFVGDAFKAISGNGPLKYFVLITFLAGAASGMGTALFYIYAQDYMGLGEYFFLIAMVPGITGILSVPVWLWIAAKTDKHRPWGFSLIAGAIFGLTILTLQPGPESFYPLLAILSVVGVLGGVGVALPSAVLGDVADYELLKSSTPSAGNYFSILSFLSKFNAAIGNGAAFFVLAGLGYVTPDQAAEGASTAGNHVIMIPFVLIPMALNITAGILVLRFPITRAKQAIIAKRLAQRQARMPASELVTEGGPV